MPTPASTVRITGPLASFAEGLRQSLLSVGYTPLSTANVLRLAAHLSRWMHRRRVPVTQLPSLAEQFVRHRRRCGYTGLRSLRGLRPIMAYLASTHAIEQPDAARRPMCPVLEQYREYLRRERRLSASSVGRYATTAARLLARQPDLRRLTAAGVTAFIRRESRHYSVGMTKLTVTAVRAWLRYLFVAGAIEVDLRGAVPAVAGWRLTGLPPRGPSPDDVAALLAAGHQRTAMGRRDYAVLLLLARLGVRAVEVATLTLDDVRWATGEIVIRSKGAESRLPLPPDVGRALVAYVRVRGAVPVTRTLFLRSRAPQGPLAVPSITAIVARAGRRAGVRSVSAHRLRHALATTMLRRGASLSQIAQVLRHRSVDTTAIYAKVDTAQLRPLARPWPLGAA